MGREMNANIVDRGSAPDWLIIAFGAVIAVLAFVNDTISTPWGIVVGLVVVVAGCYDMFQPSALAVLAEAVAGALLFALPWIGGFAASSIAWLVWAIGLLTVVSAAWSWASHPTN